MEQNTSAWNVRTAAARLRPGARFVFAPDLGGDGQTLTVATEELDIEIELGASQWVTLAPAE